MPWRAGCGGGNMLSFVSQKWAELQSAGEPLPSVAVCPSSAFCTAILSRVSPGGPGRVRGRGHTLGAPEVVTLHPPGNFRTCHEAEDLEEAGGLKNASGAVFLNAQPKCFLMRDHWCPSCHQMGCPLAPSKLPRPCSAWLYGPGACAAAPRSGPSCPCLKILNPF